MLNNIARQRKCATHPKHKSTNDKNRTVTFTKTKHPHTQKNLAQHCKKNKKKWEKKDREKNLKKKKNREKTNKGLRMGGQLDQIRIKFN